MLFNFFLLLCFYLPFQIALNPTQGVDLASSRIFILILFFFWAYDKIKNKKKIIFNTQAKAILVLLFLSCVSLFFAQNYLWSARKLAYLFSIFPLYFVAKDILTSRERMIKTLTVLVLSASLASIIGIIQFSSQFFWSHEEISNFYLNFIGPIFWGENLAQMVARYPSFLVGVSGQNYFRSIAVFPDPHAFSLFLGMVLPFSVILFFSSKKKILWVFSFGVIFVANILTFSRGGYVAIAMGLAIFIFVFWKRMIWKHRIVSSLMVIFFILMFSVPGPVSQRFVSSFDSYEGSNMGRIAMWQKSWEIIQKKPFFGTGIGNFSLEVDNEINYRNPIYAHNTYLDIAVETGILSGLVWIFVSLITFWNFWVFSKKDMIYSGFFTSLAVFSVHSLVETGLYSPIILALFLVTISFYPKYEKK
ncbi:MAG: O-antigen ligase family protein [Candidatus Moraniibacteriota bacterium]